jgi:hypothetical protein
VIEFFELRDLLKIAGLPVAGGVLDQTVSFLEALHFVQTEESRWQAALRTPIEDEHGRNP